MLKKIFHFKVDYFVSGNGSLLYVPSTKGKTFFRDDEPACLLNSIVYSDHSVSVLQRWGTHAWVPCDVAVFSNQFGGLESCQSLAQLEGSIQPPFRGVECLQKQL